MGQLRNRIFGIAAILPILLATACSVDSAKSRYVLAEKLWTDGNYAAAVSEFDKVVQKDSRGTLGLQARFRAAMTQTLYLGQHREAIQKFQQFIEISRDDNASWEAQKQIGEILFSRLEQYDQVIQHYTAMLKQRPKAEEAPKFLFRIAKSRFYLWQFDEAIDGFREIEKRFPKSPWAEKASFEVGLTYFTRGEQRPGDRSPGTEAYQDAIDAYQRFIRHYPKSPLIAQARFGIASCLEEMDQLDAAYHQYEALESQYPSPNVIKIKLARIRERKAQRNR